MTLARPAADVPALSNRLRGARAHTAAATQALTALELAAARSSGDVALDVPLPVVSRSHLAEQLTVIETAEAATLALLHTAHAQKGALVAGAAATLRAATLAQRAAKDVTDRCRALTVAGEGLLEAAQPLEPLARLPASLHAALAEAARRRAVRAAHMAGAQAEVRRLQDAALAEAAASAAFQASPAGRAMPQALAAALGLTAAPRAIVLTLQADAPDEAALPSIPPLPPLLQDGSAADITAAVSQPLPSPASRLGFGLGASLAGLGAALARRASLTALLPPRPSSSEPPADASVGCTACEELRSQLAVAGGRVRALEAAVAELRAGRWVDESLEGLLAELEGSDAG